MAGFACLVLHLQILSFFDKSTAIVLRIALRNTGVLLGCAVFFLLRCGYILDRMHGGDIHGFFFAGYDRFFQARRPVFHEMAQVGSFGAGLDGF